MSLLLEVKNLKTYLNTASGVIKAVDGIDFAIQKGETFCLVGESGSGKSIAALSIMQLLPEDLAQHPSGEITLHYNDTSQPLLNQSNETLTQLRGNEMAMIFQEPMTSLNPVFTIGEQIAESLELHHPELSAKEIEQRVIQALEDVHIKDPHTRIDSYPHQLSGGQRQRVMIAMALSCEPSLLIADEPTTALDVTVQAEILTLIKELQIKFNMGVLFITHDLSVVSQIADTVGVMQQGKLVELGTPQSIFNQPDHPYTKKLIAALPENLPKKIPYSIDEQDTLLEVSDLRVWFPIKKGVFRKIVGHVKAVDDVSFSLPKGQILAVVGESGSGKSTLGKAILQLQKSDTGSILYRGDELNDLSYKKLMPYRKKIQVIFQDPMASLNPRLTVHTTLTEPMKVHGIGESDTHRTQLAIDILEQVQLKEEHLWRYPHAFSGGQKQRIGLARALVLNPEIIVCDEITSALDVSIQAEVLALLLDLREKRDLSLLFITHNIGVVEYLADETLVMREGKIIEKGKTAQICNNPKHTYTQELISAVPRLKTIAS